MLVREDTDRTSMAQKAESSMKSFFSLKQQKTFLGSLTPYGCIHPRIA
jgi:hypothetical protein